MRRRVLVAVATVVFATALLPGIAAAQHVWAWENRSYFDPLVAEPRAANILVLFPAVSDPFPFVRERGKRLVWDITLGKEIPVLGYETDSGTLGFQTAGGWAIGLWLPVSWHMVEDFKDPSRPILNADYRFGAMGKLRYATGDRSQLGLRLSVAHESTHLGDEFALAARQSFPDFERINVSYEAWEYGLSFERSDGSDTHFLTLRHGGIGLLDPEAGFYSFDPAETNGRAVPGSARSFEPSFGFQYHRYGDGILSRGPFVSMDLRRKIVYDYFRADESVPEDTAWSVNAIVGLRSPAQGPLTKGVVDFYLRFYHGVNPNGQFRSQADYTLYGIGIFIPI